MKSLALALALLATPALASDPGEINALAKDWGALSAQIDTLTVARDHTAEKLQSLAKDYQAAVDAESRLKWVLDNWVPKAQGAE